MSSVWSVQSSYKEEFGWDELELSLVESSFERPACQEMSLGAEELKWVESSELAAAE
jgi:hypothetical protein